ncbi:hypothetical protein [Streptomyces sp. S.PB5]|uniref:hypothetical protein n=1 Tax=Streptomyces sp. S.PB5 TaxID=3020844 RepID=UPI0025AF46C9|nr:hypothetical protein [Streptomyces sp. S.PB5]MDN3024814.1 hypothetical protein [Streptomyces sp. S.PB5]
MLDLTVRALAWILTVCTPRPRGRHRLGTLPPLRVTPMPPPRRTELLDETELRLQRERRRAAGLATLGIDIGPKHIHGIRIPTVIR